MRRSSSLEHVGTSSDIAWQVDARVSREGGVPLLGSLLDLNSAVTRKVPASQ
jgi:hypothetical protein